MLMACKWRILSGMEGWELLVALYLKGLSRPFAVSSSRWPLVLAAAREGFGLGSTVSQLQRVLGKARFLEEAALLSDRNLLYQAVTLCERQQVMTPLCPDYPPLWIQRLGGGAPPALWVSGRISGSFFGVVGSRVPTGAHHQFVTDLCARIAVAGEVVISGGAHGVDTIAAQACAVLGTPVVELLPGGHVDPSGSAARWSIDPPGAPFSTASAMQRNFLIYAASVATVAVHPRFKVGGTWAGASEALRRRITKVGIFSPLEAAEGSLCSSQARHDVDARHLLAERALIQMGAFPLRSADDVFALRTHRGAQASLWGT